MAKLPARPGRWSGQCEAEPPGRQGDLTLESPASPCPITESLRAAS